MVLNVLGLAMAGTAILLTGAATTRKIFVLAAVVVKPSSAAELTAWIDELSPIVW